MKYLKLLRWNNLLMIFFVQMLTQFALVNSLFYQSDSSVTFPVWLFGVISMGTLLIAGGGYVINDIYDVAIDAVNKPRRRMIENYITKTQPGGFMRW